MRRFVRAGVAALVAVGVIVVCAGPALAHAGLVASDPADGVTLVTPPDRVLLTFSEPPDLTLSDFGMLDASGAELALHDPELTAGQGSRQVALAPMDALGDGV